ncbi:MAG: ACP S-malonyltransferase [Gammaproteobacteria bacterium]|jgi:[acyl-carrier-protein] S-malonyltransferase|nr:ACP S-malonyltransferase [Gammaproteobacteria bacterium]
MAAVAFVFPGQGSQAVGMMADLAAALPVVRETFDEASTALGFDLWQLVREGPAEQLNLTHNTQPAMLAAGVAAWRAWQQQGGPQPAVLAGHSLGEYTALVAGDAIGFVDAVRLVAERGRLMQAAVPEGTGAMAAILGLDDEQVRAACSQAAAGEVVEAVNYNSPGQVVIAGQAGAVARAVDAAKALGAKRAVMLPVSVPSHCALMRSAAERLAEALAALDVRLPRIPVLHNVDVAVADSPAALRDRLARQLHSPVRWVETVQRMAHDGVGLVVECGPGKVLSGLVKRIDKNLEAAAVFDAASLAAALETAHAGK